jgi:hypothetical protein
VTTNTNCNTSRGDATHLQPPSVTNTHVSQIIYGSSVTKRSHKATSGRPDECCRAWIVGHFHPTAISFVRTARLTGTVPKRQIPQPHMAGFSTNLFDLHGSLFCPVPRCQDVWAATSVSRVGLSIDLQLSFSQVALCTANAVLEYTRKRVVCMFVRAGIRLARHIVAYDWIAGNSRPLQRAAECPQSLLAA